MAANRDDFTFFHPLRVRWAECDAQGIVFNVNYFVYFDVGMTEYLRGFGYDSDDFMNFLTVHAEADYLGSAKFDEEIEIGIRCDRLGTTSMTLAAGVFREGELLTSGELTYVHANHESKEKSPLPSTLVERIIAFENMRPKEKS